MHETSVSTGCGRIGGILCHAPPGFCTAPIQMRPPRRPSRIRQAAGAAAAGGIGPGAGEGGVTHARTVPKTRGWRVDSVLRHPLPRAGHGARIRCCHAGPASQGHCGRLRRLHHGAETILRLHRGLPADVPAGGGPPRLPGRVGRRARSRFPGAPGLRRAAAAPQRCHDLLWHERRRLFPDDAGQGQGVSRGPDRRRAAP